MDRPFAAIIRRGAGNYLHFGAVFDEVDLDIGQQAVPIPDLLRDRDLAFRGDTHLANPSLIIVVRLAVMMRSSTVQ